MRIFALSSIVVLLMSIFTPVHAATILFDLQGRSGAGMLTTNENPSATGTGSGGENGAGISYDTGTRVLTINVGWGSGKGFTNLTGNVTAAHIHDAGSAAFTANGGVIVSLDGATPGFSNSSTSGGWTNTTVTLTAGQETSLLSGFLYLNAHTSANGGGEIRGNLVQVPEPSRVTFAMLGLSFAFFRRKRTAAI